jgi:hypothetical protein
MDRTLDQQNRRHMNIGDRVHIAPGASSVVIIREIHDHGLVTVEHEIPGTGVYPYLTKPDHFMPATTEPPTPTARDEAEPTESAQSAGTADNDSYLDELNAD